MTQPSRKLNVALYGNNGHQIQSYLSDHPHAQLVATAAIPREKLPAALRERADVRQYNTLEELLADERVELVSLCSPRRADQAEHAIRCLEAGKHVYAEKPAALSERDLDRILAAAQRADRQFREMAGTAFEQPYLAIRQAVARGEIGTVVQVLAQKSYPLHGARPQDENVDGGLLLQVGVHALRFIEHVAGVRVASVQAVQSQLGNPTAGELRIACSLQMRLENGGLATVIANYLNPPIFPRWGNEMLRIFGTNGFVEATDGGQYTRLITRDRDHGALTLAEPSRHYHDLYLAALLGLGDMPLTSEEELHPTRIVLRARESATAL